MSAPRRAYVGCAGWSLDRASADRFPADGTHLARYAAVLSAVEINSSFYRPHRRETYVRWAASTGRVFRFAVKVPREITHEGELSDLARLEPFLDEVSGLGVHLGPLLVQLPPSFAWKGRTAARFFARLRACFAGDIVCEPRHASWFTAAAERVLVEHRVARVAADPARVPAAAEPGGYAGLVYYRLHGSPVMYRSSYDAGYLDVLATRVEAHARRATTWCIFDNTTLGAALPNALELLARLRPPTGS